MSRILTILCVVLVAGSWGCTGLRDHRRAIEDAYASGRFDLAAASLDRGPSRSLHAGGSELLWKLDRGAVALALGDHATCLRVLEEAERENELAGGSDVGDSLARWAINDAEARYVPQPYEDVYINVLKLMSHLQSGRISGGATVEARRLASKSTRLRDRYLTYRAQTAKEVGGEVMAQSGGWVSENDEGNFIESPLGTYLACVAFMADGESNMQRVAARRLLDSIRLQGDFIGPVRAEDFEGLETRRLAQGSVLLIALSGRGPSKRSRSFGPIVIGRVPVYFELPVLIRNASRVARVEAEIEGEAVGTPLALVEDLNSVAMENHRRALPVIQARTIARAAVKAAASYAATQAARQSVSDRDKGWVTVVGVVGGLAAIIATERADTRAWVTLPGQAHVAIVEPSGHAARARLVYRDAGGGVVYTSRWLDLTPGPEGLRTHVVHYWN